MITKENTANFINEYLMKGFILNFVPGIILFLGMMRLVLIATRDGFTSFVVVISSAWTLGLIQEILFFNKYYQRRGENTPGVKNFNHYLLLAKTGSAIIISYILVMISLLPDWIGGGIGRGYFEMELMLPLLLKAVLLMGFGLFLMNRFLKKLDNEINYANHRTPNTNQG
ncbi:MAG: hypothetical protein MRZ79_13030 [Bacteroidia bacterium]|nr:hypothetical protein [Bacteroidia bacterium]